MPDLKIYAGKNLISQIPFSAITAYSLNIHPEPGLGLYALTISKDEFGINPQTYFFADSNYAQDVYSELKKSMSSGADVKMYLEAVNNRHL